MSDDGIHDVPHARNEDPVTSHLSAAQTEAQEGKTTLLKPNTGKHLALQTLQRVGPATGNDVDRRCGRHGLWKRVSDCKNAGLVKPIGTVVDPATRRKCQVWQLTPRGSWVLGLLDNGMSVRLGNGDQGTLL